MLRPQQVVFIMLFNKWIIISGECLLLCTSTPGSLQPLVFLVLALGFWTIKPWLGTRTHQFSSAFILHVCYQTPFPLLCPFSSGHIQLVHKRFCLLLGRHCLSFSLVHHPQRFQTRQGWRDDLQMMKAGYPELTWWLTTASNSSSRIPSQMVHRNSCKFELMNTQACTH